MKILIMGANGQLGKELERYFNLDETIELVLRDRDTLDIVNYKEVKETILSLKPDVIINAAAYTNVDGCETDYEGAYAVNVIGARNVAKVAHQVGCKLIHISTDFIFDGEKRMPYYEYDATNPLSVYGKTKLGGEWAIRNECSKFFIIRTSWLYGKFGNNFVKTMIKLGLERSELSVVTDQVGCPTYAADLVALIARVINSEAYGVYHFSNSGGCSWNEFAKEIFKQKQMAILVHDTTSAEFVRPATRPAYSVMDTKMTEVEFGVKIRSWQDALAEFINIDLEVD